MAALPLIVFDVNETLLDRTSLEPTFERIFRDKAAMRLWFANLIMYSAALTVAGCYVPFTDIGSAVMKMLADARGITISEADKKELLEKFSTMPPHREVQVALRKLRQAGFRLFTLTDNLLEVQTRQLQQGSPCVRCKITKEGPTPALLLPSKSLLCVGSWMMGPAPQIQEPGSAGDRNAANCASPMPFVRL
jgi:hypothetical protein